MDFVNDYLALVLTVLGTITSATIAITSLIKALKSEKRVIADSTETRSVVNDEIARMKDDVKITRQGIVQGFKDAVVTKDIKVSINSQVKKLLDEYKTDILTIVNKSEERKTQLTYWALKILRYTAAFDKLTVEQQSELDEVMALIADDEKIVDTYTV